MLQGVRRVAFGAALVVAALAAAACSERSGCLGGDDGRCVPASPCARLRYACEAGSARIATLGLPVTRVPGLKALGAPGDIQLENDRLTAVLDGLGDRHYLAPSGGSLLDLAAAGSEDQLPLMFQAVGILPDDAARYDGVELIDESPRLVAAVFRGQLDGRPELDLVTRYELRACEPGLRIRSELYHGGVEPLTVFLSDGFFWGDRGAAPFVPVPGGGFRHPELELEELGDAFRTAPFVAALPQIPAGSAYASLGCSEPRLEGFHTPTISAFGLSRRVLHPGDSLALERFVVAAPGRSGLGELSLEIAEARRQLFDERWTRVSGRVVDDLGRPIGGDERLARILFYQPGSGGDPDDPAARRPWAEVIPDAAGQFRVALPRGGRFRAEAHQFGRPIWHAELTASAVELSLPDWTVPRPATLDVRVTALDGQPLVAELIVVPAPPTRREDVAGSVYGLFDEPRCAPYLGSPHAAAPACNRVLVGASGAATFRLPPGSFDVFATHGPFWTAARRTATVASGASEALELALEPLSMLPPGVLSADFHVHSGRSFDSSFPDSDRALSFVAAGVDVIVATDHEVVTSYDQALADLGLADRVRVVSGVETTGHILFLRPPGSDVPKVIGHFNFWPLAYDPAAPRNGAPDDERLEPGALFDRFAAAMPERGVIQLNHPFIEDEFGRDQGYFTALGWEAQPNRVRGPDATVRRQLERRPAGGRRNVDFDVQEVMGGHSLRDFMRHRSGWFGALNQGILRAGTANSDSHTLAIEALGYPRNLVFDTGDPASFDRARMDRQVRSGRSVGSNGPVLLVCWASAPDAAECVPPALEALPDLETAELRVRVLAAPWIPVAELRVIVNGALVYLGAAGSMPTNPFGSSGVLRFEDTFSVRELLAGAPVDRDAWIVLETGLSLPPGTDIEEPVRPDPGDVRYVYDVVAPGSWPTAFTNPFVIDRTGGGFDVPPEPAR